MYLFTNIMGVFIFDAQFNVIEKILFKDLEDFRNKDSFIEKIKAKNKDLREPNEPELKNILLFFKNKVFLGELRNKNLQLTKESIKKSVSPDVLIIHAIKLINDVDKAVNLLAKRAREWYELYNPEFSRATESHEIFTEGLLDKEKNELLGALGVDIASSMGADLRKADIEPIKSLALQIQGLYKLRKAQESYISSLMEELCPNTKAVCGFLICAKLIEHAGSLKRLSEMPASTIQILGAENALFRHMRTGAKPPRHGVIVHHPLIAGAPERMHGKVARALADKISIASKIDYFKGKFIGDELRRAFEEKFKGIK